MARKILLADDSVTAQNMGRKILADAGYEVITVNNGSAALKKIAETRPDLIVLDVYMPGYSGLEVCQRVKEVGDTANIPILLTVGKLEPFKPEEAKRVRADAFIVKPFEASELLSALSKLEDKVVPRADGSKTGRFGRITAALDEGKYDKTMAVDEEDSGWKNRLSFPPKKKVKAGKDEDVDDPAIYNPINKDLRTMVDHHRPSGHAAATRTEAPPTKETPLHVGALAPEGLPKDVTAEEIAALAAAAARISGTAIEEKPAPVVDMPVVLKAPVVETAVTAGVEVAKSEIAKLEALRPEAIEEPRTAAAPPATFAVQQSSERTQGKVEEKIEEKKNEHKSGPAEVMAAIAGLETEWISLPAVLGSETGVLQIEKPAEEPVTMAVAGAEPMPKPARWSAVAVAVAPEESAISLEQEMQAALAAAESAKSEAAAVPETAIAETLNAETKDEAVAKAGMVESAPVAEGAPAAVCEAAPAAVPESSVGPVALAEPAAAEIAGAAGPIAAVPNPEISEADEAQPAKELSGEASVSVRAAVKEFEAVTAKCEAESQVAFHEPPAEMLFQAEASEPPVSQVAEAAMMTGEPVKSEEKIVEKAVEITEEKIEATQAAVGERTDAEIEQKVVETKIEEQARAKVDERVTEENAETKSEEKSQKAQRKVEGSPVKQEAPVMDIYSAPTIEFTLPVIASRALKVWQEKEAAAIADTPAAAASVPKAQVTDEIARSGKESPVRVSRAATAGGVDDMAKRESETAAAWASWRKIRESGGTKPAKAPVAEVVATEESAPENEAAMAVAAGAESKPEEVASSLDSDPEIASIVDNVLADMRPRIVEEIARKLGKKK